MSSSFFYSSPCCFSHTASASSSSHAHTTPPFQKCVYVLLSIVHVSFKENMYEKILFPQNVFGYFLWNRQQMCASTTMGAISKCVTVMKKGGGGGWWWWSRWWLCEHCYYFKMTLSTKLLLKWRACVVLYIFTSSVTFFVEWERWRGNDSASM